MIKAEMQKKIKRKAEKYSQKSDTRLDLDCLFPGNGEDHVWFEDRWMVASLCDE
jgi:hypothetical protein